MINNLLKNSKQNKIKTVKSSRYTVLVNSLTFKELKFLFLFKANLNADSSIYLSNGLISQTLKCSERTITRYKSKFKNLNILVCARPGKIGYSYAYADIYEFDIDFNHFWRRGGEDIALLRKRTLEKHLPKPTNNDLLSDKNNVYQLLINSNFLKEYKVSINKENELCQKEETSLVKKRGTKRLVVTFHYKKKSGSKRYTSKRMEQDDNLVNSGIELRINKSNPIKGKNEVDVGKQDLSWLPVYKGRNDIFPPGVILTDVEKIQLTSLGSSLLARLSTESVKLEGVMTLGRLLAIAAEIYVSKQLYFRDPDINKRNKRVCSRLKANYEGHKLPRLYNFKQILAQTLARLGKNIQPEYVDCYKPDIIVETKVIPVIKPFQEYVFKDYKSHMEHLNKKNAKYGIKYTTDLVLDGLPF